MCARRHGIPVVHSAAFHQAQPQDYPKLYLDRIQPISFHKFGGTDPYEIYMKRLHDASTVPASRPHHSELWNTKLGSFGFVSTVSHSV